MIFDRKRLIWHQSLPPKKMRMGWAYQRVEIAREPIQNLDSDGDGLSDGAEDSSGTS